MITKFKKMLLVILTNIVKYLSTSCLSGVEETIEEKDLLMHCLKLKQQRSSPVSPHSEEGRQYLKFWFEVRQMVDNRINQLCNAYYDGKHPKHYLWLGHNQYLYDNVRTGERVLDIGCGSSYYQQWIAEKADVVVGVDILEDRIKKARRNNQKQNVHFECMDITSDFPSGQFDVVICSHVLEHIENPVLMLSALAKKVPRLLVKVPLEDSHWMKLVKRDIGISWLDDADHRREYTIGLLQEQLKKSGWKIKEMIRGYDLRATAVSTHFLIKSAQ